MFNRLLKANETDNIIRLLDDLDRAAPPPVELLVYAIRAILSPSPEYSQLPDLIRLLTMVEFWRIRAMSVVSTALVWQAYYKQVSSQTVILLSDQEEFIFKDHEGGTPIWREIFINLVATCLSTHLLRLWLNLDHENPESQTLFWVYWNEYFKVLENPSFPVPSDQENQVQSDSQLLAKDKNPHLVQPFHHRLSIGDIDQLLASLDRFANFIRPSMDPGDHHPTEHPLDDDDNGKDPSPTFDDAFIDLINDYLDYVPLLVNEVHNLFPNKFSVTSLTR